MGREPLGFGLDPTADRLAHLVPEVEPQGERRAGRLGPPGPDDLDARQHGTGPADDRPQRLVPALVRHEQRAVLGLQKQVVAAQQAQQVRIRIVRDRLLESPSPVSVHGDLDRVLGPVRLDLGHRRVQESGDVVRRRRSEEAQIVADRLQVLRGGQRILSRPRLPAGPTRERAAGPAARSPVRAPVRRRARRAGTTVPTNGRPGRARSSADRAR